MATSRLVWNAILSQLQTATTGLVVDGCPLAVSCCIDWPTVQVIQNVARGGALVSVFDRGNAKNTTRWPKYTAAPLVVNPTGITTALSSSVLTGEGSVTITLGGTVNVNDAVSAILVDGLASSFDVARAVAGDTPSTMATKLASAINVDATASKWVTASAAGVVVTITSKLAVGLKVASNVGNTGYRLREIGRVCRDLQITVWTQREEAREAVGDTIETLLYTLQSQFGVQLADGTWARVLPTNDVNSKDTALQDVYRRDFLVDVEYGITEQDETWAVLGSNMSLSGG